MKRAPHQSAAVYYGWLGVLLALCLVVAFVVNLNVGRSFIQKEISDHWQPASADRARDPTLGPPEVLNNAVSQYLRTITVDLVARSFDPETRVATRVVGAGFFVAPNRILSSYELVGNAGAIAVIVHGPPRAEYVGSLVEMEPRDDLALLSVNGGVPGVVARLRDSDGLATGERVFFVGNQLGQATTVVSGVVAGRKRDVVVDGQRYNELLLFTDTAGDSALGGPLVDEAGNVIAIHIVTPVSGTPDARFGYALPINAALPLLVGRVKGAVLLCPSCNERLALDAVGIVREDVQRQRRGVTMPLQPVGG